MRPAGRDTRCSALVVGAALAASFALGCFEQPIEDGDRGLFVTVGDLSSFGAVVDPVDASLRERRVRYLDRALDIEYEFEAGEQSERPLYLSSTVTIEPSERDARVNFGVLRESFRLTASFQGLGVKAMPAFSPYGDDSYFAMLDYDDAPVGNLFVTRKGRKVYFFVVSGFYFDEPALFAELVEPKLAYLDRFEP